MAKGLILGFLFAVFCASEIRAEESAEIFSWDDQWIISTRTDPNDKDERWYRLIADVNAKGQFPDPASQARALEVAKRSKKHFQDFARDEELQNSLKDLFFQYHWDAKWFSIPGVDVKSLVRFEPEKGVIIELFRNYGRVETYTADEFLKLSYPQLKELYLREIKAGLDRHHRKRNINDPNDLYPSRPIYYPYTQNCPSDEETLSAVRTGFEQSISTMKLLLLPKQKAIRFKSRPPLD